jgi:L-histidine N-alpha-methyltransferase
MADATTLRLPRIRVERVFADDDRRAALLDETFWGLRETPKQLSPKWLYDERGSILFDEITRLHEYYPFRRERSILRERAGEIAALTGADTLVELGSGTSEKTRILLDALEGQGTLRRFVPLDVSEEILESSARAIAERHPEVEVHAVVGDFERNLNAIPSDGGRLVAFLGSTIGNLYPVRRRALLEAMARELSRDDFLLIGVDLVKDPRRIEAAYNDDRGITEAFIRNALRVLDRELGSAFGDAQWTYDAPFDPSWSWVDLGLRSIGHQVVAVPELDVEVAFADGEKLRMEVSTKFTRAGLVADLGGAGLTLERFWTDDAADYALCLAARAS